MKYIITTKSGYVFSKVQYDGKEVWKKNTTIRPTRIFIKLNESYLIISTSDGDTLYYQYANKKWTLRTDKNTDAVETETDQLIKKLRENGDTEIADLVEKLKKIKTQCHL
ncbi:SfiI-subtelomeric fragment related protein family member, putative [Theileria annulata]|uniref:SfiI-subtelomeric related protein family member, putative n=1 Tax=Theileria annulata TaxID=5874 RepID=Q4UBL4_THEAN|nr:SfiI-subtelomeric fragment related protein family member, putative [Theileria annulata]CAI75787.1 SfiI-subtelomeric fragment related protein family member, putative [Theileria annulata]